MKPPGVTIDTEPASARRPRSYRERVLCALLVSAVLHLGAVAALSLLPVAPASAGAHLFPGERNPRFVVSIQFTGAPAAARAASPTRVVEASRPAPKAVPPPPVEIKPAPPPPTPRAVEPLSARTVASVPPPDASPSQPAGEPVGEPGNRESATLPGPTVEEEEATAPSQGGAVFAHAQTVEGFNPSPPYPRAARQRGWQGTTVLRVQVLADGTPDEVQVAESSGYRVLDEASMDTVRKWRFQPARLGDEPVTSWVEIRIRYQLVSS